MIKKNDKTHIVAFENSIKKSNEFSIAKLNKGLTLNQMQLLSFAIYSTQQNGSTEFRKMEFEKKFSIEKFQTVQARNDSKKLMSIQFSVEDLSNSYFEYWNVFQSIRYKDGVFRFTWTTDMIPHILELKEKYTTTDLSVTSQFKSGFAWILYDYIKAHYGFWHKTISKTALMRLFGVEDKKTYIQHTGRFKKTVLDVAIAEINALTEFEVRYVEEKKGLAIVGFDLIWSNGSTLLGASLKQIKELNALLDSVFTDLYKYTDLKNEANAITAKLLIRELEAMRIDETSTVVITRDDANKRIYKASVLIKQLETFYGSDLETPQNNGFYNWLDERE